MAWICGNPPRSILSIRSVTIHRGRAELLTELRQGSRKSGVLQGAVLDLADRVHDRGVIAAVEGFGYRGEGQVGELTGQVHRDLPRSSDGRNPARGEQGGDGDPEPLGDR